MSREPVGTCCIVLHSHLPWVLHHGAWPVGEEWLHQAWASSYLPVIELLERLALDGRTELLTLGITPILAAQLDDAYALHEFHTWLGFWQSRAEGLAASPGEAGEAGRREYANASRAVMTFEQRWRSGASPVLRPLVDSGVVELLGGPATHPFMPLLDDRIARFALATGLDDASQRLGHRLRGLWLPECGYRPGLEDLLGNEGVGHLLLDGPTLLGVQASTADAWTLGESDVVAFGRDLEVTYRVWSPRRGYPGGPWYRDFHSFDHDSGIRRSRVTSARTPPEEKAPYDPDRASMAVASDVEDFVSTVHKRLTDIKSAREGRPGLVVVGYDTELFGHWWHEGPAFLEGILRALPEAGVRVTTLGGAIRSGHVTGHVDPGPGSWGTGKDWQIWDGEAVTDVKERNAATQARLVKVVESHCTVEAGRSDVSGRRLDLDQLAREALLALSSDWAFMVSHDSAAEYARSRSAGHAAAFDRLASAVEKRPSIALDVAAELRAIDGPFAHVDARLL